MTLKHLMAVSAGLLAIGFSSPALAQSSNNNDNNDNNDRNGDNRNNDNNNYYGDLSGGGSEDNDGSVMAEQDLTAIIADLYFDEEVIDADDEDGFLSGNNTVQNNAFSAFSGILNQAWNTGVLANTQAATNIAASGTVNFGNNDDDD